MSCSALSCSLGRCWSLFQSAPAALSALVFFSEKGPACQFSSFPLWSEALQFPGASLEILEHRTALLLLLPRLCVLGMGRGMSSIEKHCVIQWMAVTNLCVSSILIIGCDYSFPSSVSSVPF